MNTLLVNNLYIGATCMPTMNIRVYENETTGEVDFGETGYEHLLSIYKPEDITVAEILTVTDPIKLIAELVYQRNHTNDQKLKSKIAAQISLLDKLHEDICECSFELEELDD